MELPEQAQYAPVQTLVVSDFDTDGKEDLILLGNSNNFKLRIGKFDANYGTLFMGNGNGTFNYMEQKESGLHVSGNVQSAITINNTLFLGMSGDLLKTYKLSK
jgi:hypothetical protein